MSHSFYRNNKRNLKAFSYSATFYSKCLVNSQFFIYYHSPYDYFFRQEKKAGHIYTPEQKAEVIESVLGLTQNKCERALLARAPESIPAEKIRPLTESKTELKIVVNQETMAILERLKDLLSNKMPHATYADLLDYLAREKVEILEKKQMGTTLAELECVSAATGEVDLASAPPIEVNQPHSGPTPRKYISIKDRRWTMRRARG